MWPAGGGGSIRLYHCCWSTKLDHTLVRTVGVPCTCQFPQSLRVLTTTSNKCVASRLRSRRLAGEVLPCWRAALHTNTSEQTSRQTLPMVDWCVWCPMRKCLVLLVPGVLNLFVCPCVRPSVLPSTHKHACGGFGMDQYRPFDSIRHCRSGMQPHYYFSLKLQLCVQISANIIMLARSHQNRKEVRWLHLR